MFLACPIDDPPYVWLIKNSRAVYPSWLILTRCARLMEREKRRKGERARGRRGDAKMREQD
jgi:hypothetical protein